MTGALRQLVLLVLLVLMTGAVWAQSDNVITPQQHRRGGEQTFLTFPEWFLVHSPAEYASYVQKQAPDGFPFWGHIGQFWSSYRTVHAASREGYPFNFGYHVMIMVIGSSTTVEYAMRSFYETLIGRVSGLTQWHGMTAEDRLGAKVAEEYVNFIRVLPWYEFDFIKPLKTLWTDTELSGPDMLRKWERRYALTTEYGVKAGYAWLIKFATKAAYDEAELVTAVVIDRLPGDGRKELPQLKLLKTLPDGRILALVPRYEAFKVYASRLAQAGVQFHEVAGNTGAILITALVPAVWEPASGERILFTQPIITRPMEKRVAIVTTIPELSSSLRRLHLAGMMIEHVYDY